MGHGGMVYRYLFNSFLLRDDVVEINGTSTLGEASGVSGDEERCCREGWGGGGI